MRSGLTAAIEAARDEFVVQTAISADQMLEAYQFRFKVYCEEHGCEPDESGLERDVFDPCSRHVLARDRDCGNVLGTVRIALSDESTGSDRWLIRQFCPAELLASLPLKSTAEISRFVVTNDRNRLSPANGAILRLCLIRGLVQVSHQSRITHWCTLMEGNLLRLFRASGVHLEPLDLPAECKGMFQPAVCRIGTMLSRMLEQQPTLWGYITGFGTLWTQELEIDATSGVQF